ncbi:MutS-related protein [Sinanaerobacter sp. ZZT-01]|uniref:lysine 5,6-aminomutase reactivase ATPase KamC n=1 Tax=Sinanaerobacter sp. ZZT-01 TaxID=3111540 RepID=UPI002D7A4052|nr:hypothetical protein [Sinanaerobacter sp. ZZT-01]WRR94538.1 hypothetical protein U5921_05320 [Sinanaerobacter sp. ZZT-01]
MSTKVAKHLSNSKTKIETGFEDVLQNINTLTPFGTRRVKNIKPFMPGDEADLRHEFDKLDLMIDLVKEYPSEIEQLTEIFMEIKEIAYTLDRSIKNVLSVVELYEIKTFLLLTKKALDILSKIGNNMPLEFKLQDTVALLDIMDPGKDRINTFYIYDQFSEKLAALRKEKREIELAVRKELKQVRRRLEQEYKFQMTPKCELLIPKSNTTLMQLARSVSDLEQMEEDYMTITFKVKANDTVYALQKKMSDLNEAIEEEELIVRTDLSVKIAKEADALKKNCERIGNLDFTLAKAFYAELHHCIRPTIVSEHVLKIEEGRHLLVEKVLKSKGKQYCPVSVSLSDGVSCITGANMGGKTISLKMIGLVAMMAQYGFFVPCKSAQMGLSNYMHILIGDSQNVQRGLSSFGSEMEELREILDKSQEKSLLLIDEIASGTNPIEGLALTKSLIHYLMEHAYITVITTHFDHAAVGDKVHNMQVRGLADADFNRLAKELAHANRKERIEIVGRYMDYRLYSVKNEEQIPRDALNIARILGIYEEIIDYAREIMQSDK